jgi:hypothetical protein
MQITNIKVNCTDVVLAKAANAEGLQRTLYCGYFQSRCNGSSATNAYAAAFDWRDTGGSKFTPDLLYNDTYSASTDSTTGHAVYQRLPQVRRKEACLESVCAMPLLCCLFFVYMCLALQICCGT